MLRAGYDIKLAAGAITAGGCLGILIPPSVLLIGLRRHRRRLGREALCGGLLPRVMLARCMSAT